MNLHDELGRLGADATARSARSLGSVEVRDALGARVRRGRRVRTAGGAGVVAAVALVAVGVWSVLPGIGDVAVDPALPDEPEAAGMPDTRWVVDGSQRVDPAVPWETGPEGDFVCGGDFGMDVSEGGGGVIVHDEAVLDVGAVVSTSSWTGPTLQALAESEQALTPEFWDDAFTQLPVPVVAGENAHVWTVTVEAEDTADLMYSTRTVLVRDGVLVAVGNDTFTSDFGDAAISGPDYTWSAEPGMCDGPAGLAEDGVYVSVLVTQLRLKSAGDPGVEADPVATVVASAGEIEYTGLGEPVSQAPDVDDASADTAPVDPEDLPELGSSGYLAATAVTQLNGDLSCAGTLAAAEVPEPDYTGEAANPVPVPLPRWIETGRLYGYGDDALIGGYPIPLGTDAAALVDEYGTGPARLVLSSDAGDAWVFDVSWSERDDLPHDAPGWFVALSQVWDCGDGGIIEPGDYEARLVYSDVDPGQPGTALLTPITIVSGVPSIPELDEG